MTGRTLASDYLSAIERGDLDAILALFHRGAIVHSPLYGPLPATEFYPRLLADTGRSELHLRGVTQDGPLVSIWFRFDWTLPSGSAADFATSGRRSFEIRKMCSSRPTACGSRWKRRRAQRRGTPQQ